MTDLTVLVSPIPLAPETGNFTFGRRSTRPLSKPIMVTLETEVDEEADKKKSTIDSPTTGGLLAPPTSQPRRSRTPRIAEPNLLSPPVNTWKSRPKHRPTRSQSAPPERRTAPPATEEEGKVSETATFNRDALGFKQRNPNRSFTSFTVNRQTTQGGELVRPPPPLLRPTTFWRKTRRSGVTGASYSPATHLIRRSTYIAAGLTFDAPVHDLSALKPRLNPRQLTPTSTTNPTTSTTFDFWWPFPAATTTSPVITASIASTPLILFSLVSDSSSVINTAQGSSTTSSPTSSSSNTSLFPQTASSPPVPVSNTSSKSSFNLMDVIPAVSAVGIFLIGLAIWLIYGCCTRKPRIRTDDGVLICGPPYGGDNNENNVRRDVEEQGQEDKLEIPKCGRRGISGQYRWPSYDEPPPFDPAKGFHVPDEYKELDDDNYLTASLLAPPTKSTGRSESSRTKRSHVTKRSVAGPSCAASPFSDATSIALLELYESDDEEERRRAKEVPWESLRHKSIKRGILEQVKKETKWIDSMRGSIVEGAALLGGREPIRAGDGEEDIPLHSGNGSETKREQRHIGRRRGHMRADSDFFLDSANTGFASVPTAGLTGHLVQPTQSKDIPKQGSVVPASDVHRGFTWRKDDQQDLDKYTPVLTRNAENRSKSRSRSRSSSPLKKSSYSAGTHSVIEENDAGPISRDVLPNSPPQILSPPLESQMCFTPIAPSMDAMLSPGHTRSKSTSRTDAPPTKSLSPRKSRKLHSRTPPHLPFPDSGGMISPRPEAYRGRLVKKKSARPFGPDTSFANEKIPARPPPAPLNEIGGAHNYAEGDEAIRKVDKIMESSWNARDLGDEGIRCLSPSGFGREV